MAVINELMRVVPPPNCPVNARGDWNRVESDLGLVLPADFKVLIGAYGLGQFLDFITPLTPFDPEDLLISHARRLVEAERSFRAVHPQNCPYPSYPEPGGLLEWAGTDNGDRLCWLTEGEPEGWITVAWNPRSWRYDTHDVGAAEFLLGWLTGGITTTIFDDANEPTPWYTPFRPRS